MEPTSLSAGPGRRASSQLAHLFRSHEAKNQASLVAVVVCRLVFMGERVSDGRAAGRGSVVAVVRFWKLTRLPSALTGRSLRRLAGELAAFDTLGETVYY